MLDDRRYSEDPFISSSPDDPPPGVDYRWATSTRLRRPGRIWRPGITPIRTIIFFLLAVTFLLMRGRVTQPTLQSITNAFPNTTTIPFAAFQPPEATTYRIPDTIDTFESYKYRDNCQISSLDLHAPFSPLCQNREEMVTAMAGGGRIGHDAPYMPRGCDMRWFTTEEVCEILGRFDRVILVGDSMLRHITGSLNVLMRKDIGYGAVTDWNFSPQEREECFCNEQFDVKACSVQGIYQTGDVLKNDPESLKCSNDVNVMLELIVRFPIPDDEVKRLQESALGSSKKEIAFIFGHGLWSDLDLPRSLYWLDTILAVIKETTISQWYGLFITPNAAGKGKPDDFIMTQGNKALMIFEEQMGIEAKKRGLEHLGTWNMSIQANTYDGVHLDMKGNLVKAMMVMNWLNLLPV